VVWQQAHTLGLKRVVISERAALFTDLPQMGVELSWGQLAEYQSMRWSVLSTAVAERAGVLCCVLFLGLSAQALAQTSATDNPGPAAAQPSVPVQEKPATAAEEKPPVADTAEQKPALSEEKPAIAQDKRAAVEEKSAATDDKPAVVEQKPAPAEEKPAVAQDKPATVEEKSAAVDGKPAIVEQKPATAEAKPTVAQDKPAAVEEKSAAVDNKPAIAERKPTVPDAKPAVARQKPAPAKEKPAVAHGKPALKQKPVARQSKIAARSEGTAPGKPVQPAGAAHKPRERTLVMLCTRFRTYDPSSGTYRGYDGQTHSCR
jgi:BA14K-like protein